MFDGFTKRASYFPDHYKELREEFENRFAGLLRGDWEDAFHDVLIEIEDFDFEEYHQRTGRTVEQAYIGFRWRAACNIIRKLQRQRKKQKRLLPDFASQTNGLEKKIDLDHLKHVLAEAVLKLNLREREVLQAVVGRIDWLGLGKRTYEEVAESLGDEAEAIRLVWNRSLRKLRSELRQRDVGCCT